MSIFSKLFGKKKNEDQWAKRHSVQDIDHCELDETQMMSNESEKSSLSAINVETVSEERTGPRAVEVKIPWGTPRAQMTDSQREAARAYDRMRYAERKRASFELDVDGCMPV